MGPTSLPPQRPRCSRHLSIATRRLVGETRGSLLRWRRRLSASSRRDSLISKPVSNQRQSRSYVAAYREFVRSVVLRAHLDTPRTTRPGLRMDEITTLAADDEPPYTLRLLAIESGGNATSSFTAPTLTVTTDSPEGTVAIGDALGAWLRDGDVVLLHGDLGPARQPWPRASRPPFVSTRWLPVRLSPSSTSTTPGLPPRDASLSPRPLSPSWR